MTTVYTGDGQESVAVPAAGTSDYYPSLKEIANLFKKAVEDFSIHNNGLYIGDPDGELGVYIAASNDFEITIPVELWTQSGGVCLPFLWWCEGSDTQTPPGPAGTWAPYPFDDRLTIEINLVGVNIARVRLRNLDATYSVFVRGVLWFPKRHDDTPMYKVT